MLLLLFLGVINIWGASYLPDQGRYIPADLGRVQAATRSPPDRSAAFNRSRSALSAAVSRTASGGAMRLSLPRSLLSIAPRGIRRYTAEMRLRAKYQDGVLRPQSALPLAEGEEVELVTVPNVSAWLGILANPDRKTSVAIQHETMEQWASRNVSR